jgi:secondary thiamine-phosphate synthase enzyme
MPVYHATLTLHPQCPGLHEITGDVAHELKASGLHDGVATVFCPHTSASLVIMENADPSARADLQAWLDKLVPENSPHFTHTMEGTDDMPSHIKMALTRTSESIPFADGRLMLGTWQGVFFWEHRRAPHHRTVRLTFLGE